MAVIVVAGIGLGAGAALWQSSALTGIASSPAVAASGTVAHDRIAQACLPASGKGLQRAKQSDEDFRYQSGLASAEYFTCALTREPKRFCGADEKALLVKELLAYFDSVGARQYLYDKYVGDRNASTMVKMAAAIEGQDGGISSRPERPEPEALVVTLMKELVRDGYIGTSDFGWFLPPEIEPYLSGVETIKSSC